MILLHCGYGKHFLQFAVSGQCMNDNTANRNHVARNKTRFEQRVETLTARCHSGLLSLQPASEARSMSTTFKGSTKPQSCGSCCRNKNSHVTEQPLEGVGG
jgi:hypothetical protein